MFKYGTKSEYILGISASTRKVDAVLVHDAPSGPVVIRTFSRKRASADGIIQAPEMTAHDEGSDFSFNVAEPDSLSASAFLASEFGGVTTTASDAASQEIIMAAQLAVPCDLEIQDIVTECSDAGYDNVLVVFALSTEQIGVHPIRFDSEASKGANGKKKKTVRKSNEREKLLKMFRETHISKFEDDKTLFLPLVESHKGDPNRLAVYALGTEPITISLQSIRDRKHPFPNVGLMDTEITLMLGLVRASLLSRSRESEDEIENGTVSNKEETTVLVRVGAEDTLVMFLSGDRLVHLESLRSITAFDPPETICSRILLMHDEFGASDADNMVLFSDVGEISMYKSLSQFFPGTSISLLRDVLPVIEEEQPKPLDKEGLLATAVALRIVRDELFECVFPDVDFMDQKLKGRKIHLPFSWPVAAMILVLFGSTLFFVHKYFVQSHALEMTRYEMRNFPDDMIAANADDLQMKIDSLRMRSEGFVDALDQLDSLLVGSDVWSRALERTSVYTADISGLWIERWDEKDSGLLSISGTATDRDQIVAFATQAGANIERLEFSEIRGWPVYTFEMSMRLERVLPEAAVYLRENAPKSKEIEASADSRSDI